MAYVEITLEEMEQFLKRAYRALRPKKGASRGEIYYDLNLSDQKIFVRVWTSIRKDSERAAGAGVDPIRVSLITGGGRGLMPKSTMVKRTGRWKATLQDHIEDLVELYESKPEYWKGRQSLKDGGAAAVEAQPPSESGEAFVGAYRKMKDGNYGVVVWVHGTAEDEGIAQTRGGQSKKVRLLTRESAGPDPWPPYRGQYCEVWRFEDVNGAGGSDRFASGAAPFELVVNSVVERYLSRGVV